MAGDHRFRRLEINGGEVEGERPSAHTPLRLQIPAIRHGYADAQIDDYGLVHTSGRSGRRHYPWRPGVRMQVRARFSQPAGTLLGTAGFGFWNAPFGDPTVRWPALPQAVWYFYASAPNDLPFSPASPGRGWFAATVDATTLQALALIPAAPLVLLANQIGRFRRYFWPRIQRRLGIAFAPVGVSMTDWHAYELHWLPGGCEFRVDGRLLLKTPFSPRGPLGFVCWLDNQYLILTPNGRLGWGTLPVSHPQWLEVADLQLMSQKEIRD